METKRTEAWSRLLRAAQLTLEVIAEGCPYCEGEGCLRCRTVYQVIQSLEDVRFPPRCAEVEVGL